MDAFHPLTWHNESMKDILHILKQTEELYIFGAQSRAQTLMGQLKALFPDLAIAGYLVDDEEDNVSDIEGVPVIHMKEKCFWTDGQKEYPVLIATKGVYHERIAHSLETLGFCNVIPVSVEVDNCLRNAYVSKVCEETGRAFVKLETLKADNGIGAGAKEKQNVCVYVAKSIYDRELETPYEYPVYEQPIQVGAALTEQRLGEAVATDDTGDNISERNRQYSELTGLYWVWKNRRHEIAGLAHYRRHFVLPEDWADIMREHHIDVIVPVPTYVYPDIDSNYRQRHIPDDWDFLLAYLYKKEPEAYSAAKEVFSGSLYLPCNMFIASWEVLDELCGWMFPILDAVAKNGGVKEDVYLNRYVGFVSERLITLFFTMYHDKYKIAYADRIFLR